MHHGDMNFSSLMLYEKSIKESKLSTILRNLKRGWSDEQNKIRFKKRTPNKDGFIDPKVKVEGGSTTQGVKSTCARCGEQALWEMPSRFRRLSWFPTITTRGNESNQSLSSVLEVDAPKRNHFYALQAMEANSGDDAGKL